MQIVNMSAPTYDRKKGNLREMSPRFFGNKFFFTRMIAM